MTTVNKFSFKNYLIDMFKIFKTTSISSLQKKYDKLMKEAYELSKADPQKSQAKQLEAQELNKQIISMRAA